jgi:hypothetical protein
MTNNDNDASKPPTMLMSRPSTEQREKARRWEKARRVTNGNDEDASRPPTMMTTTMTTMRASCKSLPFFIGFFIVWLIVMG